MKKQLLLAMLLTLAVQLNAMDAPAAMPQGQQETETSLLNDLPDEIKEKIATFLTTAEGKTVYEKLFAAVKNIRALAGTNRSLYGIVNNPITTNTLIQLLAQRYTNNSPLMVVAALRTTPALEWLNAFLEKAVNDVKLQQEIASTLTIALNVSSPTTFWWLSSFIMDHIPPSIVKLDPSIARIVLTELAMKKPTQKEPGFDALQLRKIVDYLVASSGINLNDPVDDKHTLFYYAIGSNNVPLVKLLMSYRGVRLNVVDPWTEETPLLTAIALGRYEIVRMLLQYDVVNVNVRDNNENTPLSLAVLNLKKGEPESVEIVQLLLNRPDIRVNWLDPDGNTVLDYFFRFDPRSWSDEQRKVVDMLQRRGAVRAEELSDSGSESE